MAIYASCLSIGVSCPSDTSVTLIQLRRGLDAGGSAKIIQWGISFDSATVTSNVTPARVALVRQTTGGTMTAAVSGIKYSSGDSESICSWRREATAEPTFTDIIETYHVPVTGGPLVIQYPLGREIPLRPVNERIGIVAYAQAGSAASALAHIIWEE